jgi:hypothetical protein
MEEQHLSVRLKRAWLKARSKIRHEQRVAYNARVAAILAVLPDNTARGAKTRAYYEAMDEFSPGWREAEFIAEVIPNSWKRLAKAAQGKTCPPRTALAWAAENCLLSVRDVPPETAPSPQAVLLLKFAMTEGHVEFLKMIASKNLGTKAQWEQEEQFADEGRRVTDAIDRCREARRAAREPALLSPLPEGHRREPAVPAGNDPVGVEVEG